MDLSAKVLQHSELTRLIGCLEHHHRQPKDVSKTVRECCVEVTLLVKKAHISGTLSGFNYQLKCSSVYPRLALFYQLIYDAFLKHRLGADWSKDLERMQQWLQREEQVRLAETA